jgi:muramidase (phage lysozyme)
MLQFINRYSFIIAVVLVVIVAVLYWYYMKNIARNNVKNKNVQAFLKMIRHAEGTSGPNGYKTMFTGKLFDDFSKHPNIKNCAMSRPAQLCSTAAGAYQFLFRTWNSVSNRLGLTDFSPENQDIAAVELIRKRGGLDFVLAGDFDSAVQAVAKEWASMPGAGYNQPEKQLAELKEVYVKNGGQLA